MNTVNIHFYQHFKFLLLFLVLKWCSNIHYLVLIAINEDGTNMIGQTSGHFLISLYLQKVGAIKLENNRLI